MNTDRKSKQKPRAMLYGFNRCLSASSVVSSSFGAEGEIRTLEASLEDSHVSSYITSAFLECAGRAKRRRRFGLRVRTADFEERSKAASRSACRRTPNWKSWQDFQPATSTFEASHSSS